MSKKIEVELQHCRYGVHGSDKGFCIDCGSDERNPPEYCVEGTQDHLKNKLRERKLEAIAKACRKKLTKEEWEALDWAMHRYMGYTD